MANFTGPVPEGGNVAVVEQIVAFTDDRRMELLMKAEKASRSAGCPGSRGRGRAGWKPCRSTPAAASRFPGITGESEAMLRLKASILKAAAHGREKGGGERTGHQPCHALPPHGTAWAAPRKAG